MAKEHYTQVMNLNNPIPCDKLQKAFESLIDYSYKVMSIYLSIFKEKSSLEKELESLKKKENQALKDDVGSLKK